MQKIIWLWLLITLVACASGEQAATQLPERPTQAAGATDEPQPPTAISGGTTESGIVIAPSLEDGGIWAVDPQANKLYQLADATAPNQLLPWTLSPDGKTLAVVVYAGPTPKLPKLTKSELWLVNTDESNPRLLFNLLPEGGVNPDTDMIRANDLVTAMTHQRVIWTSTNEIILSSLHEGQPDLYAIAADTGAAQRLTNTPDIEFALELAPNGTTLAYSSVSSFGTGAGFGNPLVWIQELDGEPRIALRPDAIDTVHGLTFHGWSKDHLIISGFSQIEPRHSLFIVNLDGSIKTPELPAGMLALDAAPSNTLLSFTELTGVETTVSYVWDGGNELQNIADVGFPHLIVAPNRQRFYGCDPYSQARPRQIIDINGGSIQLDEGMCGDAVWSADSQWLAIGSVIEQNQEGIIINAQGETVTKLEFGAIPVGWSNNDLLYFLPVADGWQLYQIKPGSEGIGTPLGQPLPVQPHQPTYIER